MTTTQKVPFDIDEAMTRLREAVRPYPLAALFQLAEEGFSTAFEQLLACMISIRTFDETTIESSHRLFARARTPAEVHALGIMEIDSLIQPSTFHEGKARQMAEIARIVLTNGASHRENSAMLSLAGSASGCSQ